MKNLVALVTIGGLQPVPWELKDRLHGQKDDQIQ